MADRRAGGEDSEESDSMDSSDPENDEVVVNEVEILDVIKDGLKELWKTGTLFDITLKADGVEFQAHRAVLAAASPFFMAMFSGVWAEAGDKKSIDLKGVTAVGLRHILEYIYTGKLAFNPSDTAEVMMAADHLQVLPAIRYCIKYLKDHIDTENCVDVLNIAQMHDLDDLNHKACKFIQDNFQKVLESKYHCSLKLSDFLYFVNGQQNEEDVVEIGSEMMVFSAVLEWLRYDEGQRIRYLEQAMEVVRFPLLSPEELEGIVQDVPYMTSNIVCQQFIKDAQSYHRKPVHERIVDKSKYTTVRSRESVLVTSSIQSGQIKAFSLNPHHKFLKTSDAEKWVQLQNIAGPGLDLAYCVGELCTLVVNGFLIVLVVQESVWLTLESNAVAQLSAFVFDPRLYKWSRLADYGMAVSNTIHTAVVCAGDIYVFMNERGDQTVEILRYSFETNTWKHHGYMVPKLPLYTLCEYKDQIYVFGIKYFDTATIAFIHNPKDELWVQKASGSVYLSWEHPKAFVFGEKILHVGIDELMSFDIYRPDEDSWNTHWLSESFSDLSVKCELVMCGGHLFFLNDMATMPHTTELKLRRKSWTKFMNYEAIPRDLSPGSVAVSLRIPRNRLAPE